MDRTCERCGKTFSAKRTDARLCGPACRQAASRAARGIRQGRKRAAVQPHQRREARAPLEHPAKEATSDLDRRLAAVEAHLDAIEGRLVGSERTQTALSQKQASLEQRVRAVEETAARIPNIETSTAALAAKVKEIRLGLKGVRSDLAEEVQARQDLASDLLSVSQQMARFAEAITSGHSRR